MADGRITLETIAPLLFPGGHVDNRLAMRATF